MKSTLSLTLIAVLMGSAQPVTAQGGMAQRPAPPQQAIMRDARIIAYAQSSDRSVCLGRVHGATHIWCDPQNAMPVLSPSERSASGPTFRSTAASSRNSILVGGLVGFGIGAALGTTVGAEACLDEPRWHCAVKMGVPTAALGALFGWLHK
jgi:hypothetical protein